MIFFSPHNANTCCLCGAVNDLTGEHKIKASALRAEFGAAPMVMGCPGGPVKIVQGVKSKELHFSARICASCNNKHTQRADREFDHFHQIVLELFLQDKNPIEVFCSGRYALASASYLNVFRYFAKLLCCHLAEVGAPRPQHLSRFALGRIDENCVHLMVDKDWAYEQYSKQLSDEYGPLKYACNGSLVIFASNNADAITAFYATLTIGRVRYIFLSRLTLQEQLELRFSYPEFFGWCCEQAQKPISDTDRLMLGL